MKKKRKQEDKWGKLVRLIRRYTDAAICESWKGGGDPESAPLLEARLELARTELNEWIAMLRRDEE